MNFLFSPVVSALIAAGVRLSQVDGKPGLSADDFRLAIAQARNLATTSLPADVKADRLAEWIRAGFSHQITNHPGWDWVPLALGWLAVVVGRRLKLIA